MPEVGGAAVARSLRAAIEAQQKVTDAATEAAQAAHDEQLAKLPEVPPVELAPVPAPTADGTVQP